MANQLLDAYWALPIQELMRRLDSSPDGLSSAEAAARLARAGPAMLHGAGPATPARILWRQLKSPLLLLLVFASLVAALAGEWTEATIVLAIVTATVGIGYAREHQAENAAAALKARVGTRARVIRDGKDTAVAREDVVPGDVVLLSAGGLVPADAVLLDASDLFVSESALTGESFPAGKSPGETAATAPLASRTNVVFLGTDVRGGTARCVAVRTGRNTEIGAIAGHLSRPAPESAFDRGLRRFGYLVTTSMLMLALLVFAAHVLRGRPPAETLLFSIALAVGLSPELMPAILSVNLARGAHVMASRGVLVRRLNAIENLGSMDVLCTDKTGTLTEGVVRLEGSYGPDGTPSPDVAAYGVVNASLVTSSANPLDQALVSTGDRIPPHGRKLGEVPFDFSRRRVSVVVEAGEDAEIITKGAAAAVLDACSRVGDRPLDERERRAIDDRIAAWSRQGTRVLAIACKRLPRRVHYTPEDESALTLRGFLTFVDRPKDDAARAVADLARLNVRVKVISGDQRLVAEHVAREVGLRCDEVLTGADLDALDDVALWRAAETADVFAEVDPNQKERILRALKRQGHIVGFLGDGINDAPAMHAADTSLSVEGAVDVAREAADFVLLERDLDVIRGGIEEGRRTFANTLKYILTTMSANLGNMISMATASLVLPFLPMTAAQILLNNLLSDLPALGIADDAVDAEAIAGPPRWNVGFIRRFMIEFGLISSLFDMLTFALLLFVFRAGVAVFQTGWFVESLLTELVVALVVRTARPSWASRPGALLRNMTIGAAAAAFLVPFAPGAGLLGFVPLPGGMLASLAAITLLYAATVEFFKMRFYRRS